MSTKFYPSKTDCGILVENGDWTFNGAKPDISCGEFFVKNTPAFLNPVGPDMDQFLLKCATSCHIVIVW